MGFFRKSRSTPLPTNSPPPTIKSVTVRERIPLRILFLKAIRSLRKAAFELPPEPFDHRQLYELSRSTTASDIQSIYQLGEKTKEQVLLREQAGDWEVDQIIVSVQDSKDGGILTQDKDNRSSHSSWDVEAIGSAWERESPLTSSNLRHPSRMASFIGRKISHFLDPAFPDVSLEREWNKEAWYGNKSSARLCGVFLLVNWILFTCLYPLDSISEKVLYYGVLAVLSVTSNIMVMFDVPVHPSFMIRIFFQVWFCMLSWFWGISMVVDSYKCGFFVSDAEDRCGGKNFLAMIFYLTALPAVSMLSISRRLYNVIAQVLSVVLMSILIVPHSKYFFRNVIVIGFFYLFVQWLSYQMEMSRRRIFLLQHRVRKAFKALHKAQAKADKAAKERDQFSSYIFHEVRVPLNNVFISVQLLKSEHSLDGANPETQALFDGLEGALQTMGQILNDVLDLQKTLAQGVSAEGHAFHLNRALTSTLQHFEVESNTKGIHLDVQLDPKVDQVSTISSDHKGLWVYGPELRIKQILSNLASNAVKFTSSGGTIRVATKLLWPIPPEEEDSTNILVQQAKASQKPCIVWRLEVHDTGPGVKPSDFINKRLFQLFAQTRVGVQTGAGSGLGLSIVKAIVLVLGGRLGIVSRPGEGAKFWVEILSPIANEEQIVNDRWSRVQATSSFPQLPPSPLPSLKGSSSSEGQDKKTLPRPPMMRSLSDVMTSVGPMHGSGTEQPLTDEVVEKSSHDGEQPLGRDNASLHLRESRLPASHENPFTVLVVDDDRTTRTIIKQYLTKHGPCIVETASDGLEALKMIVGPRPDGADVLHYDAICMDNLMPNMTGHDCVKRLRELGQDHFVIGCTGSALQTDIAAFVAAGADEVLTKPIHIQTLLSKIRTSRNPVSLTFHEPPDV
ncbi:hypothetical protein DL96DRAFT_1601700 [Flagelloscypha sp. PMI_526]|nr:hypothetical protein DL96DRAFT_1601700 [Flagelloscypha sp. PMI_526]